MEDSYRFRNDDLRGWCIGKHRDTVLSCGKDVCCHTFAIAVSLFFRPFAIILPKARFSHFEDVSGVMIPQDKVRKLVSSGMVAHEFLHTGQNLITEGIKINLCQTVPGKWHRAPGNPPAFSFVSDILNSAFAESYQAKCEYKVSILY